MPSPADLPAPVAVSHSGRAILPFALLAARTEFRPRAGRRYKEKDNPELLASEVERLLAEGVVTR